MKIYTSYFANLKNISKDIVPVSISGRAPEFYKGIEYRKLAPKYNFFIEYKKNQDESYYVSHYYEEVLNKLECRNVISELSSLSNGKDIVLLCYENSRSFCHRFLVSEWFSKNGINCSEIEVNSNHLTEQNMKEVIKC